MRGILLWDYWIQIKKGWQVLSLLWGDDHWRILLRLWLVLESHAQGLIWGLVSSRDFKLNGSHWLGRVHYDFVVAVFEGRAFIEWTVPNGLNSVVNNRGWHLLMTPSVLDLILVNQLHLQLLLERRCDIPSQWHLRYAVEASLILYSWGLFWGLLVNPEINAMASFAHLCIVNWVVVLPHLSNDRVQWLQSSATWSLLMLLLQDALTLLRATSNLLDLLELVAVPVVKYSLSLFSLALLFLCPLFVVFIVCHSFTHLL